MKSKRSVIAASLLAAGITTIAGASLATAATSTNGDSLIEKIATKFNLNKDEVQAVFDEEKTEKQAEMQAEQSERLQKLVDDGDITTEQKTLIENKQKELQTSRESEREELDTWAEQNGIDAKYLMMGGPRGDDDRLQDAVDEGKITTEQKTLIESKQEELKQKRDDAQDTLEQWAEDNGIDSQYLRGFGGHGGPGGPRGGRM